MTDLPYPLVLAIAFSISAILLVGLQPVARHIGLVDRPGTRKTHEGEVPLIGGLVMFLASGFSILLLDIPLTSMRAFFAGAMILVLVGVLDDLHELSHHLRFAAQILATGIMATWGGVVLNDFGMLVSDHYVVELAWLALPVTIFAAIGVINSLNMVDGVDGLAGSIALTSVTGMLVVALLSGQEQIAMALSVVAVVLIAFLLFNWRFTGSRNALVFMGDAGSMFLGFVLSWFFIVLAQGDERSMTPVIALWLYAVPLNDTLTMMIRRVRKGRSPFAADREHLHHLLQMAGYSKRGTTLVLLGYAILTACFGLFGWYIGIAEHIMFYLFLGLFACHFFVVLRAWKVMRFLKRALEPTHVE